MASFITTPAQLRAKAEELSSLNNSFKMNVSELEAEEQNRMGMWDGQAKEAFHQAFSSDKIQMTNFSTLIEKYVASLLTIAAKYEEAERINTETATGGKYK